MFVKFELTFISLQQNIVKRFIFSFDQWTRIVQVQLLYCCLLKQFQKGHALYCSDVSSALIPQHFSLRPLDCIQALFKN